MNTTFRITQRETGINVALVVDKEMPYADQLLVADSVCDALNGDEDYDIHADQRVMVLAAWQGTN